MDQSLHCLLSDAEGRRYDPFAEPLPAGGGMGSDFAGGSAAYTSRRILVPRQPLRGCKNGRAATGAVLVSDSVRMNRSDGALVRLMTPMLDGESPEAAQARLMKLGSQLLPLLDSYI